MREKFEKTEKIALRSSKTYKVISEEESKFVLGITIVRNLILAQTLNVRLSY